MKYLLSLLIMIALSGCKVGPDYERPPVSMPLDYSEDIPEDTFTISDEDFCHWWTIFNDPFLNDLLEETLSQNFDYRIAVERIFQARSEYWAQASLLFPELVSDFQASHYRTSRSFRTSVLNPLSPIQNFFQTGFDAIWQLDLFGRIRRVADAAHDLWEASADDARSVRIVVLSEVANTYAMVTAFQEKIDLAADVVAIDEELLELAKNRFNAGLENEQEVNASIAVLEADRANLALTETGFKLNMYSLATLLGRHPESLVSEFRIKRQIPYAAGKVPAGLPSELLRRRPDIRSAERQLAAATELVGAAVAELYPQISLTGSSSSFAANPLQGANIGFSTDRFSKLFDNASRVWGIGGIVTFPVFDFGNRIAGVNIQDSLREQAYLNYQKVVITALQEVEQSLAAYFNDEKRVADFKSEAEANRRIYELNLDQFQAGLLNYTAVLEAKEAWLLSLNTLTDTQQLLATDLIAVYKALGGDW